MGRVAFPQVSPWTLNSTLVADNFEKVMAGDLIADDVIRLNVRS